MSRCYGEIINLPVSDGAGKNNTGNILSTLDQGRQPITQGIKGHLGTLPLSAFSCERGKHLSYTYTSVNQNAGEAMEMKLNVLQYKLGIYIYMHVSYTLKIKDVLIKLIHVLQNKIKNKNKSNHISLFYEICWPNIILLNDTGNDTYSSPSQFF